MTQILSKITPEQRAPFFEDVETLIHVGFLSASFSINNINMAIRTLGPGDIFLLKSRIPNANNYDWKVWTIASSLWLVDGFNLLEESNTTPRLARMVKSLPVTCQDIMFEITSGLFDRMNKALEAVEPYCYEGASRYKWKTLGGHLPSIQSGVPGAERLGTNSVQRIWTFFNGIEDIRLLEFSQWEGFKLAASAQAPKGVKKIDEQDRTKREAEFERRQKALDKFYYIRMGVITEDDKEAQLAAHLTTKSADDLADEMYRWVSGQEDWHDKVVTDYKRRVTEKFEQEQKEKAERAARLRALQEQDSDQPVSMIAYTPEQLDLILKGKHMGHPGIRQVSDGEGLLQESLYERYLKGGGPDTGALQAVDGKLLVKEGANLTQQVAQRQVPFGARRSSE